MTFDTLFGVLILGAIAIASMALLYGVVTQIRDRFYGLAMFCAMCLLLLLAIPAGIAALAQSPSITLYKSEWSCSRTVPVQSTTYARTGATMVPITSTHQECVEYTRSLP